jgi:hypothetical protein
MKTLINTFFLLIVLPFSMSVCAFPEIPFCPAGGPPGWMNYFDYRQNQNRWAPNHYYSENHLPANYYQIPHHSNNGNYTNNHPGYFRGPAYTPRAHTENMTPVQLQPADRQYQ